MEAIKLLLGDSITHSSGQLDLVLKQMYMFGQLDLAV